MSDPRTEIIKNLIKEKGMNQKSFAESVNIPYTTLRSMLERGIGNASVDNVIKVCRGLGITTDQLEEMANNNGDSAQRETPEITLTDKDEKDIQKNLQKMINDLNDSSFAAFDGQTLDEMDEEDRELLISSLENSLRIAKKIAKQKFTPKKYRK